MKYFLCRDGSTVEGPYSADWLTSIPLPAAAMVCPEGDTDWRHAAAVISSRLPPALPSSPAFPLEPYIQQMSRYGYKVGSRTPMNAQMIKPKQFNVIVAIICVLMALVPFLVYLIIYAAEKDEIVYLSLEPDGRVLAATPFGKSHYTLEQLVKRFGR